jgi:hypothetical protein
MVQGRALRGLIEALLVQRQRNSRKARCLRAAYATLALGLCAIALLGLTLVLVDAGVIATIDQP